MTGKTVAVPKCCPAGHSFFNSSKCLATGAEFIVQIFTLPEGGRVPVPSMAAGVPYTAGVPQCRRYILEPDEEFYLLEDLSIFQPDKMPLRSNFCLENFHDVEQPLPVICFSASAPPVEDPQLRVVMPVGLFLSLPFMLATLLVYAFLPQLRNLHGKTVVSHIFAFMVGYALLATVQVSVYLDVTACIILGHSIQYFFSAGFFWSNVMSFDIYCTFRGVKSMAGSKRTRQLKKFMGYCAYAWGLPLCLLTVTILMDNTKILPPTSHLRPGIGNQDCFFEHGAARWLYFNGPIALVIASNCFMFSVTAWTILGHEKQMAVFSSPDSGRHNKDKERFSRYLKLFIVMGVNWLTELASWLLGGPDHIWYFTDVTNTLQGVFIFVILVCKRRTWTLLRVRCREMGLCFTGGKPPRSPMNGTTVKTNTTSIEWSTPPQATRTRKPNRDDRDEVIPLDPILS